jgi:hypothetical protein
MSSNLQPQVEHAFSPIVTCVPAFISEFPNVVDF